MNGLIRTSILAVFWILAWAAAADSRPPYDLLESTLDQLHGQALLELGAERVVVVANTGDKDCAGSGVSVVDSVSLQVLQDLAIDEDVPFTRVTQLAFDSATQRLYAASTVGVSIFAWDAASRQFGFEKRASFAYRDDDCQGDNVLVTCMKLSDTLGALFLGKSAEPPSVDVENVARLDLASEEILEVRLPGVSKTRSLEIDDSRGSVYLTDVTGNRVMVLDAETLREKQKPIGVGRGPYDVRIVRRDGAGNPILYVTNGSEGSVSVIQGRSERLPRIVVGQSPARIALHPEAARAYVVTHDTLTSGGMVAVLDTDLHRLVRKIPVGLYPEGIAASGPGWETLLVCNRGEDSISIIDTALEQVTQKIKTCAEPWEAVFHPSLDKGFHTCRSGHTVSMMLVPADPDLSQVAAAPLEIPMPSPPARSKVTVVPRDSNGKLLGAERHVVVRATIGNLIGAVQERTDGSYTQDLESVAFSMPPLNILSVTSTVTAVVDGVRLDQHPLVVFYAVSNAPSIKIIEPAWGSEGEKVTISGSRFGAAAPKVYFDGLRAPLAVPYMPFSDTVVVTAPPHAPGPVDVLLEIDLSMLRPQALPSTYVHALAPGGFVYVGRAVFKILATREAPDESVILSWDDGSSRAVLRAEDREFSSGVTELGSSLSPLRDAAPVEAPILYYRVQD